MCIFRRDSLNVNLDSVSYKKSLLNQLFSCDNLLTIGNLQMRKLFHMKTMR